MIDFLLSFFMLMLKDTSSDHVTIPKELKYATHKISAVTYIFDVVIKSLLDMSCRLFVACDEM